MKPILIICIALFAATSASAQLRAMPDSTKKIQTVEASCGSCNFEMKGVGCVLAVRMDGKAYLVDGTTIEDHGDPHSGEGFCEAIRKAEVQGTLVNNRYKATYFKVLPKKDPAKQ